MRFSGSEVENVTIVLHVSELSKDNSSNSFGLVSTTVTVV
jgi:hypothetical protein